MSGPLLLDTHVLIWLDEGDPRLPRPMADQIDAARRAGGALVSAVSAWELAQLVDRERLRLDTPLENWLGRVLAQPGFAAVPLDHKAAVAAYKLPDYPYRDPADRLLMGTAIVQGCQLVTFDGRILSYAEQHGEAIGLRVLGHDARH